MKDRSVEFPNRYRMVKVEGTDDIFDLVPAPGEISEEGIFINKATLLKDATAGLFGLGADAVPDDAFAYLGQYGQHWWKASDASVKAAYYSLGSEVSSGQLQASGNIYYVSPSVEVDVDGNIIFTNEVSYNTPSTDTSIAGKFVRLGTSSNVYYGASNATIIRDGTSKAYLTNYQTVTGHKAVVQLSNTVYLRSSNRDAYPDGGIVSGVAYQYLGVPFQNASLGSGVVFGSYVGTGVYGESNPTSLTVPFKPSRVVIFGNAGCGILLPDVKSASFITSASSGYGSNVVRYDEETFTFLWYCNSGGSSGGSSTSNASAGGQYNASGAVYSYIVFPE